MNIFNFKNKNNSIQSKTSVDGFTLIEAMIAVGLFTVIMVIGITAMLDVNNNYRKVRTMRSAIDNISFIMEDMTRNARLGSLYRCFNGLPQAIDIEVPQDGDNCQSLAFEPFWSPIPGESGENDDQVVYYISESGDLFKSTRGAYQFDESAMVMNSVDLKFDPEKSGFSVINSLPPPADDRQPSILIRLSGTVNSSGSTTEFNVQTTVSQRLLDIIPN